MEKFNQLTLNLFHKASSKESKTWLYLPKSFQTQLLFLQSIHHVLNMELKFLKREKTYRTLVDSYLLPIFSPRVRQLIKLLLYSKMLQITMKELQSTN